MFFKKFFLAACFTTCIAHSAGTFAWTVLDPRNYEDCILENMKGIKNDQAANAVLSACASKYYSSPGNTAPQKVRCNGQEIDPRETGHIQMAVPNIFGILKIINQKFEVVNYRPLELKYTVYVQHSYPFELAGFYLQGYNANKEIDARYWCSGLIPSNSVGSAVCENVQSSSKTFAVDALVTPKMNLYEFNKLIKKC